jgi:hypothetical protein
MVVAEADANRVADPRFDSGTGQRPVVRPHRDAVPGRQLDLCDPRDQLDLDDVRVGIEVLGGRGRESSVGRWDLEDRRQGARVVQIAGDGLLAAGGGDQDDARQ